MKKKVLFVTLLFVTLVFLFKIFFIKNPNDNTMKKFDLIKKEITKQGYHNRWIMISGHRDEWYNNILKNSAKKSYHIKSMAFDIYVFDIDGDWDFDSNDIFILESITNKIELSNPNLVGGFGTYTTKDFLSKHMVHIDTRGYKVRYNK